MSQLDQPLTTAQLAERWGISRATVNRWALEGRIPTIGKLPGHTGAYLFASDVKRPEAIGASS